MFTKLQYIHVTFIKKKKLTLWVLEVSMNMADQQKNLHAFPTMSAGASWQLSIAYYSYLLYKCYWDRVKIVTRVFIVREDSATLESLPFRDNKTPFNLWMRLGF